MKTSCEHCLFKVKNSENVQIGCYLNKSDFFVKSQTEPYFILDGHCISCRNCYWEDSSNKSQSELKNKLLKEVGLKYAILIQVSDKISPEKIINFISGLKFVRNKPTKVVLLCNVDCKYLEMFRDFIKRQDDSYVLNISMRYNELYHKATELKNLPVSHYYFIKYVPKPESTVDFLNIVNENFAIKQEYPSIIKHEKNYFVNKVLFENYKFTKHPMYEIVKYVESHNNNCKSQQ